MSAVAYAIRSTYHTMLKATPGQLVFGQDMILPIQFKAIWGAIALRKQNIINQLNKRENRTCITHNYKIGNQVLLENQAL